MIRHREGPLTSGQNLSAGPESELGNYSDGYLSGVSVVIPTHTGRLPFLARLLRSLDKAITRASEPVEVLVVDDSPEPEATAVRELCTTHEARYLRGPRRGGAKRNRGLAAARYDIVLFVDSDCVAHYQLISEHIKRIRSAPPDVGAVAGFSRFIGSGRWFWRLADQSGRYNSCFDWPLTYQQVLWGATANLAVRHEVFARVGGFDERTWTLVGGEDVAACVSIVDGGFRIITAPDAIVLHARDHMTRLRDLVNSMLRYGAADAYLCARFPERSRRFPTAPVFVAAGAVAGVLLRPADVRRGICYGLAVGVAALTGRDLIAQRSRSRRVYRLRSSWGHGSGYDEDIEVAATAVFGEPMIGPDGPAPPDDPVGISAETPSPALAGNLACVVLDWTFDVGALGAAIRRGRWDLLARRFNYMDPKEFVRRDRSSCEP